MPTKIFFSTLIVAAFFCGMYFERSRETVAKTPNTPRIYLEQLKTKMNIRREWAVDVYLNSELLAEDKQIILK